MNFMSLTSFLTKTESRFKFLFFNLRRTDLTSSPAMNFGNRTLIIACRKQNKTMLFGFVVEDLVLIN